MSNIVELDPLVQQYLDKVKVLDYNDAIARLLYVMYIELGQESTVSDLAQYIITNDELLGEDNEYS